ncbi:MAG: triose-phosphate isomerase [Clostridiales bacterium]|nr:triose-phosphate isomerase [Clostridiales bacterium]
MRKPIIVGNWKMYKNSEEARKLVEELIPLVKDATSDIVVCVPFPLLHVVQPLIKGTNITLGAQNVSWEDEGALTGEVSAKMLKDFDVKYVIVGHSERKRVFGEKCREIGMRAVQAVKNGITPIVCVGETLERRNRDAKSYIKIQLLEVLEDIEDISKVVIAYEPVWAINGIKPATKEQAEEMCAFIREVIKEKYCEEAADVVRIQYGGSVNSSNFADFMAMDSIDGGLIGRACLDAKEFSKIINYQDK